MLSVSKSSPTHLVVLSVARNLLFDNRSPLGLRLRVTWGKETSLLSRWGDIRHFVMPRDSEASLTSFGTASHKTLRSGRRPQGAPSLDSSVITKKRSSG